MPNFSYSSVCPVDDYTVELVVELKTAAQLRDSQFIFPQRPWLELYGINVRLVAPFGSVSSKQFVDPALIHQVLPDELLFEVCYYRYMRFYPSGRFLDKVEAALLYPGTHPTLLRFRLRSSNSPGQLNILERTIVFLNYYYLCLNTY
ncbi:hypothetical protein AABB24_002678 [Solanum stoloniferum]|uniref:Uncharacterized protein n=1 Tax=Solanum stoloniferum TaxID=62892 RepID=A0ABD2V4Q5_9SOLN